MARAKTTTRTGKDAWRKNAVSEAEVMTARTPKGGWTKAQLAEWGVPWPPPKGWWQTLILNYNERWTQPPR